LEKYYPEGLSDEDGFTGRIQLFRKTHVAQQSLPSVSENIYFLRIPADMNSTGTPSV
jgi:hypothetical protein